MNDTGMIGIFAKVILAFLKILFKTIKFFGIYWFLICMSPVFIYEGVTNKVAKGFFEGGGFIGLIGDIGVYLGLILIVLTTIQNIYRIIRQEPKFNIFAAIFRIFAGSKAVGFVATLNLDTAKDISGFVFGKLKGKYVTKKEETDGHMLTVGGPGSGKTSCIAIPTLMTWRDRIFAIDIKGELYEKTKRARDINFIKVFNPTDRNCNGYDPFYLLRTTDDLSSEVKALAMSICPLSAQVKDPYWINQAQFYLTGAIIYFYGYGLNFSETMIKIKTTPCRELVTEIMESDNIKAKSEISQFVGLDDKTLSGIFSELSNHITTFATNDDLIQALDGHGECITPNDLENGYDIFCCIPEHKIDQWKDLLTMMVNQFLKAFERRPDGNNKPILFLLDEFPRLGKIESVANGLATLRSKKIQIALFVQSKSQLNAIYGKDMTEVIADNCSYKAILKAGSPETQEWCSKLVGTYEKLKLSSNVNADMIGIGKGTGQSKTTEEKRIIKPEEFAFMQDVVCVFPTGYRRVELAPYYKDDLFKNK